MTNEDAIKKINLLKMVAVKKGTDTEKAVDMAIEALKAEQPRWIPVSKELPEANIPVLAYIRVKHQYGEPEYRQAICTYVPRFTIPSDKKFSDCPDDCEEYNDDEGCYYAKEGWYEETQQGTAFEGASWVMYDTVTAWMPLPISPKAGETE